MTRVEKAKAVFHNPYSCSQAIIAAFGDGSESALAEMKACSGGRAPEGRCGALWAALTLLPEGQRADCEAGFAAKAGAVQCRELKKEKRTPCERCVEIAADYLETHLPVSK